MDVQIEEIQIVIGQITEVIGQRQITEVIGQIRINEG